MRNSILALTILILTTFPTIAQETLPGDACDVGQENYIRQSGGTETGGVVHLMRCDGANWQQYMTYLSSGDVGIGTDDPKALLHVDGEAIIGISDPALTCDGDTAGAIRFDSAGGSALEVCDGADWLSLLAPSGTESGSETFTTSGTFTVPDYKGSLTVEVWGGGGGGAGDGGPGQTGGSDGTASSFDGLTAGGGSGGTCDDAQCGSPANSGGAGGSASGGDVNIDGESGGNGVSGASGKGGDAPSGGSGGPSVGSSGNQSGIAGGVPGGGGSGGYFSTTSGGGGGSGAYVTRTYGPGELTPGATIAVTVGDGGDGGAGETPGGNGAAGQVRIVWGDVGDNLGDHTATQILDMAGFNIVNAGSVQIGSSVSCGSTNEGTLRYTGGDPPWEYCDGSTWVPFESAVGGGGIDPDPFSFTDLVDQFPATLVSSDIVQITGLEPAPEIVARVSVSGPTGSEYRVCSDGSSDANCNASTFIGWTSSDGAIFDNQYLQLRHTTSAAQTTTVTTTVNVGSGSADWSTTSSACPGGSGWVGFYDPGPHSFSLPSDTENCAFEVYVIGASGGGDTGGAGGGVTFEFSPGGAAGSFEVYVGEGGHGRNSNYTGLPSLGGGAAGFARSEFTSGGGGGGASAIMFDDGSDETLLAIAGGGGGAGEVGSAGSGGPRNDGGFTLAGQDSDWSGIAYALGGDNNVGGSGFDQGGQGGSNGDDGVDGTDSSGGDAYSIGVGGVGVPDFLISGGGGGGGRTSHAGGGGGGGYGGGGGGGYLGGGNSSGRSGAGGGGYLNVSAVSPAYSAHPGSPPDGAIAPGIPGRVLIAWGGAEPCFGHEVGGHCWFKGESNQNCNTVCSAQGLSYSTATRDYAGTGGSLANCKEVIDTIEGGSQSVLDNTFSPCSGSGLGCSQRFSGYRRCTPVTTNASASDSNTRRYCACE